MKRFVPDYYAEFHCIASRCRHTCCEGWEIDIDAETAEKYRRLPDEFGKRLAECIAESEGQAYFRLAEDERCPMLNEQNLCRIILRYGEGMLCQICRDHPRFRNYWENREEIGLGLACEEAARLILTRDRPMKLIPLDDGEEEEPLPEDEQELFDLREELWNGIKETGPKARLKEYLIYRHLADALYDGRLDERIAFIENAYAEITGAWTDGKPETLIEIAREFSNRVEYDSDEMENRLKDDTLYDL